LDGHSVYVKIRSTRAPVAAVFRQRDDGLIVELEKPEEGISPGQACVFYAPKDGAVRTWGGGWIIRTA